jgi:hypothetical protein
MYEQLKSLVYSHKLFGGNEISVASPTRQILSVVYNLSVGEARQICVYLNCVIFGSVFHVPLSDMGRIKWSTKQFHPNECRNRGRLLVRHAYKCGHYNTKYVYILSKLNFSERIHFLSLVFSRSLIKL